MNAQSRPRISLGKPPPRRRAAKPRCSPSGSSGTARSRATTARARPCSRAAPALPTCAPAKNSGSEPEFGFYLVLQLRAPVAAPTLGSHVEHVPKRPDEVAVPRVLAGICPGIEQLRAPGMADLAAPAMEHVEHRLLAAFRILALGIAA